MSRMKVISIIAIILIAVGVVGSTLTYRLPFGAEQSEEKSFDPKEISAIEIRSDNPDIDVIPVAGVSEIKVEFTRPDNWRGKFEVDVKQDTLSIIIKERTKFFKFGLFDKSPALYVHLPEMDLTSLQIQSTNGDLLLQDLTISEVEIKTTNGDIELNSISSPDIQINTTNGDMELDSIISKSVHLQTVNGDFYLDEIEGDIHAETTNGDLTLRTATLDRSIQIGTTNGDIDIYTDEQPTNVLFDIKTNNGDVKVFGSKDYNIKVGDGENEIKLTTTNGDISIK